MLNKNSFINGMFVGFLIPLVSFGVLMLLYKGLEASGVIGTTALSENFRVRTMAIVAIAFNAIPMNRFQKRRYTDSMRGIVIPTMVFVVIWMVYFGLDLL